jgi:hypothetical protein
MALLEKEGNKARIGTDELGFDFWYRALTVNEYSRLKTDALWEDGNPAKIDFVELAGMAVTKIAGFPEPYKDVTTVDALLDLEVNPEDDNCAFIAESAWAMGWKIWTEINGINKKKSSLDSTPESKTINRRGLAKLSRFFKARHPRP